MTRRLLVATRSAHKLREIRQIMEEVGGPAVIDLSEAGVDYDPAEEEIEVHDSFEANAMAKARYFARRSGMTTLADDSGLCVDALGGAPGVRSKRFSGRADLEGDALDAANNAFLLERLADVPDDRRTAHYVCVAAVAEPDGRERVFAGRCDGEILREPRGNGGFGYDPLFYVPEEGATFGQIDAARKNQLSHRARAMRAVAEALRNRVASPDRTDG
ncbi:MAG TPA: RdgB/HAM1 family non-canonical purine NTP pyrophosphatase [Longimicrobiaceae bacterium]